MNKYQWFICAIIFFLLAMVFANWSSIVSGGFQDVGTIIWAIGRVYAIVTWFCFALAGICFFCGLLEKEKK